MEEEVQTFTVHVVRGNSETTFAEVVGFEPQTNAYLLVSKNGSRVAIPYSNNLVQIEVVPDALR